MKALEYLKEYQQKNNEAKFITKDDDGYVALWKDYPILGDDNNFRSAYDGSYLHGTWCKELEWDGKTIYSIDDIKENPYNSSIEITPKQTWIKNRINEYDVVIKNHIEQGLIIPFELINERNELFSQL